MVGTGAVRQCSVWCQYSVLSSGVESRGSGLYRGPPPPPGYSRGVVSPSPVGRVRTRGEDREVVTE